MADETPRLKLPFMSTSQLNKELTFNELALLVDTLVGAVAIDKDLNAPPASPADGDLYIVNTAPTGAWAGKAKNLAVYIGGWHFIAPTAGWIIWVSDESKFYRYNTGTTAWVATLVVPASNLVELLDVDAATGAPTDGHYLAWDNGTGKFVLQPGASTIAGLSDVDLTGIEDGQLIAWDEAEGKFLPVNIAADSFTGLTDTPDDYTGMGGKLVRVKGDESGLEFVDPDEGGGVGTFTDLGDAPDDYTGQGGKVVTVNEAEDGLLFREVTELSQGVPNGGTTNQVLRKSSDSDFEVEWVDPDAIGVGLPSLVGNAHKLLAVSAAEDEPEWVPLDTDGTMAANSDTVIPSQKAVKTLVTTLINALIAAAPGALDTLDELAAALGDDANFASTVTTALAGKVAKGGDTMTGALSVPDDAYGAGWNGSVEVPTKNAIYDKIEAILTSGGYTDENARDAIGAALGEGAGISIVVNDAGDTITISVTPSEVEATDAEMWDGTSSDKVVTPKKIFDAAVTQTLVDGATITIDGDLGFNFKVTLGGNRTLANPTNMKTGQSGIIIVTQDATGSRTLTYGANWRFPGGAASGGVLSTTANAVDVISYYVRSDGTILANIGKDYKA